MNLTTAATATTATNANANANATGKSITVTTGSTSNPLPPSPPLALLPISSASASSSSSSVRIVIPSNHTIPSLVTPPATTTTTTTAPSSLMKTAVATTTTATIPTTTITSPFMVSNPLEPIVRDDTSNRMIIATETVPPSTTVATVPTDTKVPFETTGIATIEHLEDTNHTMMVYDDTEPVEEGDADAFLMDMDIPNMLDDDDDDDDHNDDKIDDDLVGARALSSSVSAAAASSSSSTTAIPTTVHPSESNMMTTTTTRMMMNPSAPLTTSTTDSTVSHGTTTKTLTTTTAAAIASPVGIISHPNSSSTASSSSSSSSNNVTLMMMDHNINHPNHKEKIGRWTEQEHLIFLEGLHTHGKQWKVIATMIGTRTVVQVRTHAQKYFQKLDRNSGGAGTSTTSSSSSTHIKAVTNTMNAGAATAAATTTTPANIVPDTTNAVAVANSEKQQPQALRSSAATTTTLMSPKSTILPPTTTTTQRTTYTKRKSLPPSLPSRSPKKSRATTNKMNPRLSMGNRGISTAVVVPSIVSSSKLDGTTNIELPSYPSTISKSSSSTGSDENWSTISPDNVIWDRVDFGNSSSSSPDYALISEDNQYSSNSVLYDSNHVPDDDTPPHNAFDLLGEDPLEWLIETDCTQQYLPESSLPVLFPIKSSDDHHRMDEEYDDNDDDKLHIHHPTLDDNDGCGLIPTGTLDASSGSTSTSSSTIVASSNHDDENEMLLLRITDPNVTVQSLFLPTDLTTTNSSTTSTVAK